LALWSTFQAAAGMIFLNTNVILSLFCFKIITGYHCLQSKFLNKAQGLAHLMILTPGECQGGICWPAQKCSCNLL
jgi:hypothetical protein